MQTNIILIDNCESTCQILQSLLKDYLMDFKEKKLINDEFNIGYWSKFDENNDINKSIEELIEDLKGISVENDKFHFFVDLLLTKKEEDSIDSLTQSDYDFDTTGIKMANKLMDFCIGRKINFEITIMSKWLDLLDNNIIEKISGLEKNKISLESLTFVYNPVSPQGQIVDRETVIPTYKGKTIVGAFVNLAFGLHKTGM